MEIWTSVLHTVDPAASRLPSIRNPSAVGNAILWLTLCMLTGTLLLVAPGLAAAIDKLDPQGVRNLQATMPSLAWPYAFVLLAVGLLATGKLAPPRGREPHGAVWTDIWRIAIGLTGWLLLSCASSEYMTSGTTTGMRQRLLLSMASAAFAIFGLIGLRGVFGIIGHRSREYRRSKGGRQSLELIMVAIACGQLTAIVQHAAHESILPADWIYPTQTISTMLMGTCNFMVVIGLAYLVGNAIWIRRALRRPPPPIDQVLVPEITSNAWIPDREE